MNFTGRVRELRIVTPEGRNDVRIGEYNACSARILDCELGLAVLACDAT